MVMQTDVKAVSRSTTGLFVGGRNRLKGLYFEVPSDSAGFVDFYDGLTLAGPVRLSLDLSPNQNQTIRIPGEGILFEAGIYLFISGENAPSITIFYG